MRTAVSVELFLRSCVVVVNLCPHALYSKAARSAFRHCPVLEWMRLLTLVVPAWVLLARISALSRPRMDAVVDLGSACVGLSCTRFGRGTMHPGHC